MDFYIFYNWTAYGLTIGEGGVSIYDDMRMKKIIWQNYSFTGTSGRVWSNYTLDDEEYAKFTAPHIHEFHISSYSDGTLNANGNVTIEQIVNRWDHGRAFNDNQQLFINIKPYVFTLGAPTLSTPANNSDAYSLPVVLSWSVPSAPAGYNLSYYVYGDTVNGNTYLGTTADAFYLWRNLASDVYYWKVKASIVSQNSSNTETRQFNLNLCTPDTDFSYASNYPMSYNSTTDTITVIGNSSFGSSMNPITLENIYQYGRAVRGACAMSKPASGIYIISSQIVIGNTTQEVYVQSKSESISFTSENMPELTINKNAHLSFGGIAGGIPQEGSSVKFTSNQTDDILLDVAGGELAFYDSYVGDVGDYLGRFIYRGSCGVLDEEISAINSSITIKKTIFDIEANKKLQRFGGY